jgi:hypothetical protein
MSLLEDSRCRRWVDRGYPRGKKRALGEKAGQPLSDILGEPLASMPLQCLESAGKEWNSPVEEAITRHNPGNRKKNSSPPQPSLQSLAFCRVGNASPIATKILF